jgi:hypothetical protein
LRQEGGDGGSDDLLPFAGRQGLDEREDVGAGHLPERGDVGDEGEQYGSLEAVRHDCFGLGRGDRVNIARVLYAA